MMTDPTKIFLAANYEKTMMLTLLFFSLELLALHLKILTDNAPPPKGMNHINYQPSTINHEISNILILVKGLFIMPDSATSKVYDHLHSDNLQKLCLNSHRDIYNISSKRITSTKRKKEEPFKKYKLKAKTRISSL